LLDVDANTPNRLDEVLRPTRIAVVYCVAFAVVSLLLSYDDPRTTHVVDLWALPTILVSLGALSPYLMSIVAQSLGADIPILGVRTAHAGVLGLTASSGVAVALARGADAIGGFVFLGLAVAICLIAVRLGPGDKGRP